MPSEHRPTTTHYEERERDVKRRRAADQRRAVAEAVVYLRYRRIEVPEDEPADGVVRLLAAIGLFERAVRERGGVLIIEGLPSHRSAETRFKLPARRDDETMGEFADRVGELARRIGCPMD